MTNQALQENQLVKAQLSQTERANINLRQKLSASNFELEILKETCFVQSKVLEFNRISVVPTGQPGVPEEHDEDDEDG